jgi:Ankyrin repeats (3 copies)/MYND finger
MSPRHFLKGMTCKVTGLTSEDGSRLNGSIVVIDDYLDAATGRHRVVASPHHSDSLLATRFPAGFNCRRENLTKVCNTEGCHKTSNGLPSTDGLTADGGKLYKCMRCVTTHYCSVECQEKDWSRHKKECESNFANHSKHYAKALCKACERGDTFEAIQLVKMTNNLNLTDSENQGKTPLHFAAEQNNIEIAKILLDNLADVNKLSGFIEGARRTPLGLAILRGNTDMVRLLKEREGREE